MSDVAVPVLLLGLLTLLGTAVFVLVAPLTPRDEVPACCRPRVDSFAAHTRGTLMAAGTATGVGAVLLLLDLA
ncbi:hypothetical protein [Geodermatophilus sp. SYSU D00710]